MIQGTAGKVAVVGRTWRDQGYRNVKFFNIDLENVVGLTQGLGEIVDWIEHVNYLVFCQRARAEVISSEQEFNVSLLATSRILDELKSVFKEGSDSSVAIVTSVASRFVLLEQNLAYHVNKAALEQLVRWYAVQWAARGVRFNAVAPGVVVKEEASDWYAEHPAVLERKSSIIPLGRVGEPEDVGNLIDFLCSGKSKFLTGQVITIDGGMSLVGHESMVSNFKK
tara:strand:+ start:310 stop:981 length:672 start_codon:yes stop_codon:yes gene_type:complete